ncbi:hypothetical protein ACP4OV_029483 [Aristida adscensionis]
MSRREAAAAASPFRDVSNLRTPGPGAKPTSPRVFPASKTPFQAPTPTPLRRRRPGAGPAGPTPTPLARRLRALEVDQSRSARRAESGRERSLRAFAGSVSSWLSLLLRDPAACGCSAATGSAAAAAQPSAAGKRDALDGERARGPSPKRRRGGDRAGASRKGMTAAMTAALRDSLREACSLDDVTERMGRYMGKEACEDVLVMMCQICKNIDEGRLKMKAHCPLATDLRIKEKAIRSFLCYNPEWLRIGLHIVLGGDILLPNVSGKRDKEAPFLKLILEKQMFAQIMTGKPFSHHKVVPPHKQGCTEPLGNIILKRVFLLVAALDRAKIESALPLETGIDSLDGGSPLLFSRQDQIKSSWQIIQESLGEAMHGEGDLLMHLTTMGYKLNYQQPALSEYDFTIQNLFEDIQDGIILCRVVQLLLSNTSIILKVVAPSDMHKKKLKNCTLAIHYIKQAGVPVSDADGVVISAEDIVTGDKELILSLMWNIFIHMQIPLLADKTSLACELTRLKVPVKEQLMTENKSYVSLLYDWVQLICSKYGMSVKSSSQFDRSALNCLINYYLNIEFRTTPLQETLSGCRKELFGCHEPETFTDITSQMGRQLADFLQDIPASGILANDVLFDERSAIVLLAFLSAHLTNDKRLDQLKNSISMRFPKIKLSARRRSRGKNDMKYQSPQTENTDGSSTKQEWAATVIQTRARCIIAKRREENEPCQMDRSSNSYCRATCQQEQPVTTQIDFPFCKEVVAAQRIQFAYRRFLQNRHLRISAAIKIQSSWRGLLVRKCFRRKAQATCQQEQPVTTQIDFPFCKEVVAAQRIQFAYRRFLQNRHLRISAAIKIQSSWRGLLVRKCFRRKAQATVAIQAVIRQILCRCAFQRHCLAAVLIQRVVRGWLARKNLLVCKSVSDHNSIFCPCLKWWRKVLFVEARKRAAIVIQARLRGWIARQTATRKKKCITTIQCYVKAYLVRKTSEQKVASVRYRLQKSSAQVDDSMRLINRLVAALSQLLHCQSISSIRQTCATMSTATEYSKKCCETLVTADAVGILLKQIHLLNRSIPDQEVLKQVLLTLRNIVRYPDLRLVLINTRESVGIIFQELLRNKSDGFFIASDILKKLCESKEGHEATRATKYHIKRLHDLVHDLEKKVELDMRNGRSGALKENNVRRLREAATLYHLLTS